ncbi:PPE family protein [Mycobacterium kubicae]|uniref:PPE family protein n=1 Tax=Mycobacterium kubicae TaxID=120959 RepID=UPI001641348B|nr:PPE family protein [Mycobacterium kubicae]QNI08241.1 PPE family protein [Mycobacterium kubicae]
MSFAAMPPEVNSARMYAGPGAGSMLTAAAAWDALAVDLNSTALSFHSVISGLIAGPWLGPSAAAMTAAALPYAAWLSATAEQAEQAASQAKAAASAYEAAYAMTVPPALVAANRTQLGALVATNVLGQNTPAIAATEAQYGEMWAQDATAMYGYAASSAAATALTPFTEPPPPVSPAGLLTQAATLAQTAGNCAATEIINALNQLTSAVPGALAGIVDPITQSVLPAWIQDLNTVMSIFGTPFFASTSLAGLGMSMMSTIKGLFPAAAAVASQAAAAAGQAAAHALSAPASVAGAVSAGLGKAASVGTLSVPQAWAGAAPAMTTAAAAPLSGTAVSAVAADTLGSAANPGLLGGLPLGQMEARGITTSDSRVEFRPLRVLPEAIA